MKVRAAYLVKAMADPAPGGAYRTDFKTDDVTSVELDGTLVVITAKQRDGSVVTHVSATTNLHYAILFPATADEPKKAQSK